MRGRGKSTRHAFKNRAGCCRCWLGWCAKWFECRASRSLCRCHTNHWRMEKNKRPAVEEDSQLRVLRALPLLIPLLSFNNRPTAVAPLCFSGCRSTAVAARNATTRSVQALTMSDNDNGDTGKGMKRRPCALTLVKAVSVVGPSETKGEPGSWCRVVSSGGGGHTDRNWAKLEGVKRDLGNLVCVGKGATWG